MGIQVLCVSSPVVYVDFGFQIMKAQVLAPNGCVWLSSLDLFISCIEFFLFIFSSNPTNLLLMIS